MLFICPKKLQNHMKFTFLFFADSWFIFNACQVLYLVVYVQQRHSSPPSPPPWSNPFFDELSIRFLNNHACICSLEQMRDMSVYSWKRLKHFLALGVVHNCQNVQQKNERISWSFWKFCLLFGFVDITEIRMGSQE